MSWTQCWLISYCQKRTPLTMFLDSCGWHLGYNAYYVFSDYINIIIFLHKVAFNFFNDFFLMPKFSWYYIWHCDDSGRMMTSQQTLHTSPSGVSYGVPVIRILEKIYQVIKAMHCVYHEKIAHKAFNWRDELYYFLPYALVQTAEQTFYLTDISFSESVHRIPSWYWHNVKSLI